MCKRVNIIVLVSYILYLSVYTGVAAQNTHEVDYIDCRSLECNTEREYPQKSEIKRQPFVPILNLKWLDNSGRKLKGYLT